jgi:hypothetical protein
VIMVIINNQCKSTVTNLLYFSLHNSVSLLTATSRCHLHFSISFAVIPDVHLLYKLTAYSLSDRYIIWLSCYIISGYVLSQSTLFIRHPLKCCLLFPRICPLASLIYLFIYNVLFNSIKLSKYFVFAHTIEIYGSISSATGSTLPASDIDTNHGRCAADLMELDTEESECNVDCVYS